MSTINLHLPGGFWNRNPYPSQFYHGEVYGRDYRLVPGGAKIAFGEEDKEAAYFNSVEELCDKVEYYLSYAGEHSRNAEAGYRCLTKGKHTYQDHLVEIFKVTDSL